MSDNKKKRPPYKKGVVFTILPLSYLRFIIIKSIWGILLLTAVIILRFFFYDYD